MTEIHTTTAKWAVEADIEIEAWIEPSGSFALSDKISGVDSVEDSSSFYGESVVLSGSISYEVSASDEDRAREIADEVLDNVYFETLYGDVDWEIRSAEVSSLEKMREPMTLALAREYLKDFLSNRIATTDVYEAIQFLLRWVQEQEAKQNG